MTDGRRSQVATLQDLDKVDSRISEMEQRMTDNFTKAIQGAIQGLEVKLQLQQPPVHTSSSSNTSTNTQGGAWTGILPRSTKIDFPRFDGEDPNGWIYKADQWFCLNQVLDSQKVPIAAFYLDHEALRWYEWYRKTRGEPTWPALCQELLVRFGPTAFEDFTGALTKLRQTRSVREYQNEFEKLSARTNLSDESFFVSCFLSGLKDEVKAEVTMFKPRTMHDVIALARAAETKVMAQRRFIRPNSFQPAQTNPTTQGDLRAPLVRRVS